MMYFLHITSALFTLSIICIEDLLCHLYGCAKVTHPKRFASHIKIIARLSLFCVSGAILAIKTSQKKNWVAGKKNKRKRIWKSSPYIRPASKLHIEMGREGERERVGGTSGVQVGVTQEQEMTSRFFVAPVHLVRVVYFASFFFRTRYFFAPVPSSNSIHFQCAVFVSVCVCVFLFLFLSDVGKTADRTRKASVRIQWWRCIDFEFLPRLFVSKQSICLSSKTAIANLSAVQTRRQTDLFDCRLWRIGVVILNILASEYVLLCDLIFPFGNVEIFD